MAKKITDLSALTSVATGDFVHIVDISDTTDDAAGSSKKITIANLTALSQPLNANLTTLSTVFTAASASGPATLAFHEDTDNGTNKVTLSAPSSIAADVTLTLPGTADTLVGRDTTDTMTNKTLTSPKVGTAILDTNGNELFLLTATASAVNEFTIANAATGGTPTMSSTGGDTNIDMKFTPKGTGRFIVDGKVIGCALNNSGAQSMTNNAFTKLTFDTEEYDSDTMHSTSSNTSRITINTAGKYLFTFSCVCAGAAGGSQRRMDFLLNNSAQHGGHISGVIGGNVLSMSGAIVRHMSVNDYMELYYYQDSGGAINMTSQFFSATRLCS